MDRLSIFMTLITGSVLVGAFVIAVLSMGYYSWQPIAGAVAVGLILTWPAAYVVSRRIKRDDPGRQSRDGATGKRESGNTGFPKT